jgi:pyrroline-5-carboxylate reductase
MGMALEQVNRDGLVLLGCGKMGSAMLQGWLSQGVSARSVWVMEPNPSAWLAATDVHLNRNLPARPAIALVAVKPQMIGTALPSLKAYGGGGTLILTIAAGTTIATYENVLGTGTRIVRAMPNTPASVMRGITAICANDAATEADLALADTLLRAVGQVVRLQGEHQMDAVTAVSGSGPGYVFHFIEALAAAGVAQGLSPDLAMTLARATVAGSGELAHLSPETAARLRTNVTSPAGTTAAGLAVLMDPETGLTQLLTRAVKAAADRGRELGK